MKNLSILVSSFDKYSDLWDPYFQLLFRNWPTLNSKIFLITNNIQYKEKKVISLLLSENNSWSKSVIEAISNIETKYILFSLEDFLLKELVDVSKIEDTIEFLTKNDAAAVYLNKNRFNHFKFKSNENFKLIDPATPYVVSTQAAIWNKDKLLQLLETYESAWDFEINGSIRNRKYKNKFYCINDNIFDYKHHSVEKGKWFPAELKKLNYLQIYPNLKKRAVMNSFEVLIWRIKLIVGKFRLTFLTK
tara:strand:+ start:279 stop:1019 length:741 start_codon:yes stop_codon:yes gene_type:complete